MQSKPSTTVIEYDIYKLLGRKQAVGKIASISGKLIFLWMIVAVYSATNLLASLGILHIQQGYIPSNDQWIVAGIAGGIAQILFFSLPIYLIAKFCNWYLNQQIKHLKLLQQNSQT